MGHTRFVYFPQWFSISLEITTLLEKGSRILRLHFPFFHTIMKYLVRSALFPGNIDLI